MKMHLMPSVAAAYLNSHVALYCWILYKLPSGKWEEHAHSNQYGGI
jgi:hypothetical protein